MLTKNNAFKTVFVTLLVLFLCISSGNIVFAYERIDTSAVTSLELRYMDNNIALSDVNFSIYYVADITETNNYILSDAFADYSVDLSADSSEDWLILASTLSGYAARDNTEPFADGKIGSDGTVEFEDLPVGLYLLVGAYTVKGNYGYTATPYLLSLPNLDENDEWEYDVTSEIKYEKKYIGSETQRKVIKVWNDSEVDSRPASVTVQLLRNGKIYSEAELSESNGWTFTWMDLDDAYNWQITEKDVPDGYTVTVSLDGTTFTVTNTGTPSDQQSPDNPDDSDNPSIPEDSNDPDTPKDDDEPDLPSIPINPDGSGSPIIPQTGQLQWPIPVLTVVGVIFFGFGWYLFKSGKHDNDSGE